MAALRTRSRGFNARLIGLFFVALVVSTVPLGPATGWAKDTLVIGIRQYPPNFHPSIETTSAKTYVLGFVRRPITAYDQDWHMVCLLCRSLPSVDNGLARIETSASGGKGMAVTFQLPRQAMWGDGTPITTDDIVFTWEAGKNRQSGIGKSAIHDHITAIDVIDDKTFTLHFNHVGFEFNDLADFQLLPAHIEKPIFERDPAHYRNLNSFETDTTNPALYFGPYVITGAVRDAYVVLERNPFWWGKRPDFDRIIIRVVGDTAALQLNLLSGDIDMIAGELGVTVENARAIEDKYPNRFHIIYKPGLLYEHIDVNLDSPILQNRSVRQALLYGMDREAIVRALFDGRQEIARTYISSADGIFSDTARAYRNDPDRAVELLEEAGWTRLVDGIRQNATGEKLRVEVITTTGHRTRERVLLAIRDQWKRIGVDTVIRYQTPRELFGRTLLRREFPSMVMYAFNTSPEFVPRSFLHSSRIPNAANNFAGFNTTGFRSAVMDGLIDALESELDAAKRKILWRQIQNAYAEELPALPLFFHSLPHILPNWLEGVEPTGHQYPSSLWVENWRKTE